MPRSEPTVAPVVGGSVRPRIEVGIDCLDPAALAPFWLAALGYSATAGDGEPYLDLVGPPGSLGVFLQRVPEPKSGKNRLHLDLFTVQPERLVADLRALGARPVGPPFFEEDPQRWAWQVMRDPEGNEFCVCREGT